MYPKISQNQPRRFWTLSTQDWGNHPILGGTRKEGSDVLGHICLYAYMHKVNPNIFRYFLYFYSCITFISLFAHRSNFFSNFSLFFLPFYSLQKPVTLTRHCWFCFHLSARVPVRRAESNCIMHSLRRGEWSWSRGRKQGICGLRHPLAFSLLSVLTVTEEFLLAKSSKFLIPTVPISTL